MIYKRRGYFLIDAMFFLFMIFFLTILLLVGGPIVEAFCIDTGLPSDPASIMERYLWGFKVMFMMFGIAYAVHFITGAVRKDVVVEQVERRF